MVEGVCLYQPERACLARASVTQTAPELATTRACMHPFSLHQHLPPLPTLHTHSPVSLLQLPLSSHPAAQDFPASEPSVWFELRTRQAHINDTIRAIRHVFVSPSPSPPLPILSIPIHPDVGGLLAASPPHPQCAPHPSTSTRPVCQILSERFSRICKPILVQAYVGRA